MTGDYAPFRPLATRVVAWGLIAVVLAGTGALVAVHPGQQQGYGVWDVAAFLLLAAALVWLGWRQAQVAALPDPDGITVRNLLLTRRLAWPEVVSVRFGPDRPWVALDLADGHSLAVMGIQRADGARAERQARRLAGLVARHSTTPQDD